MALPGKDNPFTNGLTEKAPELGIRAKKLFIKIPLSTGEIPKTQETGSPPLPHINSETTADAIVNYAIAKSTTVESREFTETLPHLERTTAENAIVDLAISNPTIAFSAQALTAIAKPTIADTSDANKDKKATKVEYAIAKTAIADLADKKGGYTRVDNYVFDVLMPKIGSAPAAVVYLYLWRRSLGFQKPSVSLSHQIIAEAVGLSKRTIQEAIARLNELNLIRTHRAYETAIPEHSILRPWGTANEPKRVNDTTYAVADSAIASAPIAKNDACYSADYPPAIAESATIKRKVNKETKKSLSPIDLPDAWNAFTAQLTEKARERADRVFQSLKNHFPADPVNEIAEAPKNLERFGAPDGTAWGKIGSPIGLIESSWPQLRDFFRKRIAETERAEHSRQRIEVEQIKVQEQETRAAEESERRRSAFFEAFPEEQGRREAIQKYLVGFPFNADGLIGQNIAIGRWQDERDQLP